MIVTLRVLAPDGTTRRYEFHRASVRLGAGAEDDLFLPLDPPVPSAVTLWVEPEGMRVQAGRDDDVPVRVTTPDAAVDPQGVLPVGTALSIGSPAFQVFLEEIRDPPGARFESGGRLEREGTDAALDEDDARSLIAVLHACAAADTLAGLASSLGRSLRLSVPSVTAVALAVPNEGDDAWSDYEAVGTGMRERMDAVRTSTQLALDRLRESEVLVASLPRHDISVLVPIVDGRGRLAGVLAISDAASVHDAVATRRLVGVVAAASETFVATLRRFARWRTLEIQQEENRFFRERQRQHDLFKDLITVSAPMRELHLRLGAVVSESSPVLILGEAGSGKEMLARALHHLGPRADRMLVSITCTTLDEDPLDDAMFGYGGVGPSSRPGAFELARGGTVFLDEVHALNASAQARLVRAVQESEVFRAGDPTAYRISSRLVAATHLDLQALADEGRFRRDLALLLQRDVLHVPPLRERRDDVAGLVEIFVRQFARRYRRAVRSVDPATLQWLEGLEWPGNVRELLTLVERAVLHAPPDASILTRADFLVD